MDGTFSPLGRQIFLEATAMMKTGLGILYHQGYQATKMIQHVNPLSSSLLSLKMAARPPPPISSAVFLTLVLS